MSSNCTDNIKSLKKPDTGYIFNFRVRYYETDAMGIVHHSNYIRWFEEARTEYLRAVDLPYKSLEDSGVAILVTGVRCQYKRPCQYDDQVKIQTWIQAYNGVRMTLGYRIWVDDALVSSGETDHAFLKGSRPVSIARAMPKAHEVFRQCFAADSSLNQ